jgi:hypothetical protein
MSMGTHKNRFIGTHTYGNDCVMYKMDIQLSCVNYCAKICFFYLKKVRKN